MSLGELFSTDLFMPHGHCYLWQPAMVWLQVLSNGSIGLAYVAIFATLVYLVRRIRDMPFHFMYLAFAVFIVACGVTHFSDIYVIWRPAYWLDGSVRAVTALASVGTALLLPPLVPKAVALAEAAALSQQRGVALERANQELGTVLEKTRELEQLKTQFFANVSHELRTPLTLILGPVERLLVEAQLSTGQRRDLDTIGRSARALLKHVNDLLDVSKLEAGRIEANYVQTDLSALVRLVAANFESLGHERAIACRVELPDALPAQVDPEKLERVVLNLLANAFKFTPHSGQIRCSLRSSEDGESAVLEVADSGPGVEPQHRELVFERFRQVDEGHKRSHGGTGLGLAIVKDFVELHGGSVSLLQAPEGGALFTVHVPLRAPAGAAVRELPPRARDDLALATRHTVEELRAQPQPATVPPDTAQASVVLVEDNPEMNRFISETLAPEYRVHSARDGAAGLQLALEVRPDLIISDVMMPNMSGDELLAAVRARPELETASVMLLTARADDELRVRLLREGAQDYLTKPFSVAELRARAANLVSVKRARDVLQRELDSHQLDLESLARELGERRREAQTALESARVARDQALRASQLKSAFLGMVSHEFRTPVTALALQLERLKRAHSRAKASASSVPPVDPRQQELLERMSASVARLSRLVESLLQHAQIESGRLTTEILSFDLDTLVAETVAELRPRAERKRLSLRADVEATAARLRSDPSLVRLILFNLLDNAVKFTERGSIEVRVADGGSEHRITVRDTGPGIPLQQHDRVFAPFAQLEQVREKHLPGVGLGLSLVKEMTEALGGHVQLQSQPGTGSTFTIVLPHRAAEGRILA